MRSIFRFLLTLLITASLSAQTSVAVLELEGKGLTEMEASILTDRLRHELFQTGKYRVVERELMGEILNEQGFQLSECTSTECMVEIGQLLGVDQMVGGSVSKFGTMYTIAVRLVSVETGEFLGTATYDHEGRMEDLLKYGMKVVSSKLSGFEIGETIKDEEVITPPVETAVEEQITETEEQKTVDIEPTEPAPGMQKAAESIKKPATDYKIPTIMLRSEMGVYGLTHQERKDAYKGTTGPLFGVSAVYNVVKLPNIGAVGLLAGVQSMFLILSPEDSHLDWEEQEVYVVTKAGLQIASVSKSKLTVAADIGYAGVSISKIIVDDRGNTYEPEPSSTGGLFADLLFSYQPLNKVNITLDGGYGTLVTGKDNFYGGNKFIIGVSLNF